MLFFFYNRNFSPEGVFYPNTGCGPVEESINIKVSPESIRGRNTKAMGQSLVQNYIHVIFSTKHRRPLIKPDIEKELYSYLGGICNRLESPPVKIGGYTDHVHILCRLSKKVALVKLLEEVKFHSSKWMKTKSEELSQFYWSRKFGSYGAFSVNHSEVDLVINYIANQKEHHKKKSFQEEYRAFLEKYNVDYYDHYVWD